MRIESETIFYVATSERIPGATTIAGRGKEGLFPRAFGR